MGYFRAADSNGDESTVPVDYHINASLLLCLCVSACLYLHGNSCKGKPDDQQTESD